MFLVSALAALLVSMSASAGTYPVCYTDPSDCTSNDVDIQGFVLYVSGDCIDGYVSADLYAIVDFNAENAYCVYVVYDAYTDEEQIKDDEYVKLGNFLKNTNDLYEIFVDTLQWPCGSNLYVENIYTGWGKNSNCVYQSPGSYCSDFYLSSKCKRSDPMEVIIPGIRVEKVVVTPYNNCSCDETEFQFDITGPVGYNNGNTFDCEGGNYTFAPLVAGSTYTVTEIIPVGWGLTSISCATNLATPPTCSPTTNGRSITLGSGERVTVTFTDSKCQTADAGEDQIVCAGDSVILEGNASCYNTVGWSKDGSCQGVLVPSGTNILNATYTTPPTGEISCILFFTATGACPDNDIDTMTVNIVEQPDAEIRLVEP